MTNIFKVTAHYTSVEVLEVPHKPNGYRLWFAGADTEFWVKNEAVQFSLVKQKLVKVGMSGRIRDMITLACLWKAQELHIPVSEIKRVNDNAPKKPKKVVNTEVDEHGEALYQQDSLFGENDDYDIR